MAFHGIIILLSLLRLGTVQAINCRNSNFHIVTFRGRFFRRRRLCSWINRNKEYCTESDLRSGGLIGEICAKECPEVSGCCEVPERGQSPDFDPYPGGPYVEAGWSEQVTLPEPEQPTISGCGNECPHFDQDLLEWHSSSTWGGSIPSEGQNVVLPAGSRVVVEQTIVEKLGIVEIPEDSELVIASNDQGINIDANGFIVKGKLTAGSETCRIQTPITITLHGSRPSDIVWNARDPSFKGISVDGGILSLHGKRYYRTWTRLAKTVNPGDKVLMLQNAVNWEVGQEVVIVTSSMKDSRDYNLNEVRTIAAVHDDPPRGVGAVVYLEEPVEYEHTARGPYQVEVGLLTRTIKIQGAEDSEPTDPDPLDGSCRDPRADRTWQVYYETTQPCMNKERTGFGGHIMVHNGGKGLLEGVELYRMGQTNVLARYPMHFHLLGECPTCYFKDSSVHRSFYRCVAIHGTNSTLVTENVAFDVTGYCYYLEDGVEQKNTLSFNLAAHIHMLGPDIPWGNAQTTNVYQQSGTLTLPADVTASGFYITNIENYLIGNVASGGWSGFAFPSLPTPLKGFRDMVYRPSNAVGLTMDGNTAHSTGWWWGHAGAFYFGGSLYYNGNTLEYNPGRSTNFFRDDRQPCKVNSCAEPYNNCAWGCPQTERASVLLTNSKAFLTAGVGLNSWSGRIDVRGFESHDSRLAVEALSSGFWLDGLLAVCRTGQNLALQSARADKLEGSGFYWYDTGQSHIVTNSIFRNCGFRSDEFDQYDDSPTRGCTNEDPQNGCSDGSTTFGFLTHSDQFTPEIMQGTLGIEFQNCGRRFRFRNGLQDTVSGRQQNWKDVDGTVSGLGEETLIGSGLETAKDWWHVDDDVVVDAHGPLRFIKKGSGPARSLAHVRLEWDSSLHNQVGGSLCGNGNNAPCPAEGYIRHLGPKFSPFRNPDVSNGLPVTANADIVGPSGGYGWLLNLNRSAPRSLRFTTLEIEPDTILIVSIPYPIGTTFTITAEPASWCWETSEFTCGYTFTAVGSVEEVSGGPGNTYHVDGDGVLTLRVVQTAGTFTGNPDWFVPDYNSPGRDGEIGAIPRFERGGVTLPESSQNSLHIQARCPSDNDWSSKTGYCSESVKTNYDPDVCPNGYEQVAYDRCCRSGECSFAFPLR